MQLSAKKTNKELGSSRFFYCRTNDGDPAISPPGVHRGTAAPNSGQGVEPFHAAQAGRPVVATAHVDQTVEGANSWNMRGVTLIVQGFEAGELTQTRPFGSHWRDCGPSVHQRVKKFRRRQIRGTIVSGEINNKCQLFKLSSRQVWNDVCTFIK